MKMNLSASLMLVSMGLHGYGCADVGDSTESEDEASAPAIELEKPVSQADAESVVDKTRQGECVRRIASGGGVLAVWYQCDANYRKPDSTVLSYAGYWGYWARENYEGYQYGLPMYDFVPYEMCPAGSFVYAIEIRQEAGLGSGGDDTALNAVSFSCYAKSNGAFKGLVTSDQAHWGEWLGVATTTNYTVGNPMVGLETKGEDKQGSDSDDASSSLIRGKFKDGSVLTPAYYPNAAFGYWRGMQTCPTGQAVCGLETRVEAPRSGGDDTALNGIRLACCTF